MSYHEYKVSQELHKQRVPFYSLIMEALRAAYSYNAVKIRAMWPEKSAEMQARYDAPGGVLDTDPDDLKLTVWGQLTNPRGEGV